MKQVLAVICIALVSVGAAVASTGKAGKRVVWTESKAERSVLDGATVRLATEDRVTLEAELRPAIALYKALALESTLTGHVQDADAYYQEAYRYSRALADVQRGLPIGSVDCMGSGVAAGLTRFGTFRCNVTSGSLEIPAFEPSDDGEPSDDAQSRTIGPIEAELDVRVTGKTTFAYRAV